MSRLARCTGLAAALMVGTAAEAQQLVGPPSPMFAPEPSASPRDEPRQAFGITRNTEIDPVGQPLIRRGLIGRMPLAGNVEAGIGLYSVTGNKPRLPESRRNWSVREITPRDERIAAVGVKLRF